MQKLFPGFIYYTSGIESGYWTGTLQPTPNSPEYKIKIVYSNNRRTSVFVEEPELVHSAPHIYPQDKSLCLYYPPDGSFNSRTSYIADTIIPWTAEWLYWYEEWLRSGIWWGEEAPHPLSGKKLKIAEREL
ncbi:MAG: hypothetical protein ABFD08_02505 [Syntrophomonas sp.]